MSPRKPPEPPTEGLMDLFGGATLTAPSVAAPDPLWGALDVKWSKPPAGRHLCQDCVDAIHGKPDGPHPALATARRRGPNGDRVLCAAHAQLRRDADDRVTRQHADRLAANKAARKAVIASKGYGRRREHA